MVIEKLKIGDVVYTGDSSTLRRNVIICLTSRHAVSERYRFKQEYTNSNQIPIVGLKYLGQKETEELKEEYFLLLRKSKVRTEIKRLHVDLLTLGQCRELLNFLENIKKT